MVNRAGGITGPQWQSFIAGLASATLLKLQFEIQAST
jgi:hypothetical protein